jgi:hypothetical protein
MAYESNKIIYFSNRKVSSSDTAPCLWLIAGLAARMSCGILQRAHATAPPGHGTGAPRSCDNHLKMLKSVKGTVSRDEYILLRRSNYFNQYFLCLH